MSDQAAAGRLVTDGVVEQASWFGPSERPLFGWFAFPRSERVRGAVVLCPPVGTETTNSYRTFRTLCQKLAHAGFLALRVDYDGMGDSAGEVDDPGVVDRWTRSIREAVDTARAWGAPTVSVVGMRLGATLAYAAATEQDLELSELILWDPCPTGRRFLREHQALMSQILSGREVTPAGWVDIPWFQFSPENAECLRKLEITTVAADHAPARHLAVLTRPDRSDAALRDALSGTSADWGEATGQDELLDVATTSGRVPMRAVDEIVASISAGGAEPVPLTVHAVTDTVVSEGGVRIRERAEYLGPDAMLFGIRTAPMSAPVRRVAPIMVINPANHPHLGAGRMWVALTRALAAAGFESIRMSVSGAGNSGTYPGQREDMFVPVDSPRDIERLMQSLASGPERRVTIGIGLSSSALLSLEAAARGTLDHAVAINPGLRLLPAIYPEGWRVPRRLPSWWDRLARHVRAERLVARALAEALPFTHALWGIRKLKNGADATVILTGPLDAELASQSPLWRLLWGRRLERSGRMRIIQVPEGDHPLMVSSDQRHLIELTLGLVRRFAEVQDDALQAQDACVAASVGAQ